MDLLDTADKDLPLRDDIRFLGRILGDTVRSQEGEPVFAIVEHIRRTSIRFHRDEDEAARHELEGTLNGLSDGQSIQIIRAFSYFSQLANIAEDQHHIRRTRAHALAASAPREGTMAHALTRARDAAISRSKLENFFTNAIICPVVCTENLIRIDCVTESPNVNGDDRALLPLPDPVRLAVQVEEPT